MQVRRRWRALFAHEAPADEVAPADPDVGLQRRIGAAMERLSPGQREVFVLELRGQHAITLADPIDESCGCEHFGHL